MPRLDERTVLDGLSDRARRAIHRADDLGYDVAVGRHNQAEGDAAVVTLHPRSRQARARLKAAGLEAQEIRAVGQYMDDHPGLGYYQAVEACLEEALLLHHHYLGLVVA